MSAHPILAPKPIHPQPQQPFPVQDVMSECADIDRFATLFAPATPPATPTLTATDQPPPIARPRKSTHSSSDSADFGAFVSVPPSQDPLSSNPGHARPTTSAHNHSLVYFDQFTAHAKTAAERSRREVLDELLEHQDDPMYFLDTHLPSSLGPPPPLATSAGPIPIPMPIPTDDALAEALATDMPSPKLLRAQRSGSLKVAPGHSRSRLPLPPHLSGTASPPSTLSSTESSTSLATSSPTLSSSTSTLASASGSTSTSVHPAHATLSRISSSLVSLLPPTRPRASSPSIPTIAPSSAPSTIARGHTPTFTHGSPFASTPYIPPTGAPGFAGDRAWDRGFSEALMQEEKRGTGAETTAHVRHAKGKGVTLVGRRQGTVDVLTEAMADLIRPHLPALIKLPRHWTLFYSLDQHGISLNTLYSRSEPRIPSRAHPNPPKGGLLVIQDANDAVFGAWMSEGIRLEKGYYGSGESFLWRYHPPCGEGQGQLDVYKWTGVNAYVALCESGFISFGGGDGHYGLYLDASLLDGSSAPCPTFGNPPLCARKPGSGENGVAKARGEMSFECVGLEVWGIGSD